MHSNSSVLLPVKKESPDNAAFTFTDTSEEMEQMKKRNPMRKVEEALDIANTISLLLLEDSSRITGQVLGE
jgi:enoyl-[acyl-carrier-protein] reductase (NADH)